MPAVATEAALRASVSGELGYNPWEVPSTTVAHRRIVGVVDSRDARRRAWARGDARAGPGAGSARASSKRRSAANCRSSSSWQSRVAINPLRAAVLPAPPKREARRRRRAVPPPAPPRVVVPPAPPRLVDEGGRLRVAFGIQHVGAAPGPTFGFMGRVGFALRRWSLAAEVRGDLPGAASADGGQVSASTMAAFLVPCVDHRIVAFCLLGGGGGQEVAGSGYVLARSSWVRYAAVGARIEAGLPLNRNFALLFRVDLLVPVRGPSSTSESSVP